MGDAVEKMSVDRCGMSEEDIDGEDGEDHDDDVRLENHPVDDSADLFNQTPNPPVRIQTPSQTSPVSQPVSQSASQPAKRKTGQNSSPNTTNSSPKTIGSSTRCFRFRFRLVRFLIPLPKYD